MHVNFIIVHTRMQPVYTAALHSSAAEACPPVAQFSGRGSNVGLSREQRSALPDSASIPLRRSFSIHLSPSFDVIFHASMRHFNLSSALASSQLLGPGALDLDEQYRNAEIFRSGSCVRPARALAIYCTTLTDRIVSRSPRSTV